MLIIKEKDNSDSRVLLHEENIFHTALNFQVKNKEKHFHVVNPNGQDYDLEYIHYFDTLPELYKQQILEVGGSLQLFYEYNEYDENDDEKIHTGILDQFDKVEIDIIDEYSVAVVKQILKKTNLPIFCKDTSILWFVAASDRIKIVDKFSDDKPKTTLRVVAGMKPGYGNGDYTTLGSIAIFHNMFFLQGLTKLPLNQIKYVCLAMSKLTGVGAIFSYFSKVVKAFSFYGIETYLKEDCTRYSSELLSKYFNIQPTPVDSDETNTIYLNELVPFEITYFFYSSLGKFGVEILKDDFVKELEEYRKAIIGNKKTLGILLRGTDYITSGLDGMRLQATVEQMIPTIDKWMEEDGYEQIFLATEDQHILDKMLARYGDKVRAIAQERHTVDEFENVKLISELEKIIYPEKEEHEAIVEDTTVNYFYALYLLSHSNSFMASGNCSGWDFVNAFNNGEFKRCFKFQLGEEGDF